MIDVLIIGGGPAGLSAAIYAHRAGASVTVLEALACGGQVARTPEVENYPGIAHIGGAELALSLYEHAAGLGVDIRFEQAERAELSGPIKRVFTAEAAYEARSVIIANGAKRRRLGCRGEDAFEGRGVSYCAACDGNFYRGKETAIVGGGNTALEDALFLSNLCARVHLIHWMREFQGGKLLADEVLARDNITVHWETRLDEIFGEKKVAGIRVSAVPESQNPAPAAEIPVSGVFVAIGLVPDNGIFAPELELDRQGYIRAGEDCKTSLPGVFAAGDTRTKVLRQIVTAASDGAAAAMEAAGYAALRQGE